MGAEQSTTQGNEDLSLPTEPAKVCYYELLGVERSASEDAIRKAYRRKALELHPDRNYGDVDNATRKFAEVQSAYEVLSDPQERAWYDSHRDIILRGDDPAEDKPSDSQVNITTAQDLAALLRRFTSSTPFTDEPHGFFGTLRKTFATLAEEENYAAQEQGLDLRDYPDFGKSGDDYDDVVKPFYAFWLGFGTKKSFAWRDRFRYSDAPDRKIRRLMEKENKRHRDDGIKEFNDTVRNLVTFVRARDPRYIANAKTDAERQQDLRKAAAAQAARSRAANRAKIDDYTPSAWTQTQPPDELIGSFSESEESVVEQIECVICSKVFKSEKQYESHEKSKKHIKAVQQLKRQMRKENKLFELDDHVVNAGSDIPVSSSHSQKEDDQPARSSTTSASGLALDETSSADLESPASRLSENRTNEEITSDDLASDIDDDYAPRGEVVNRLLSGACGDGPVESHIATADDDLIAAIDSTTLKDTTDKPTPRIGKAKAKKAARVARSEQEPSHSQMKCAACSEVFTSKNKLFDHLKRFPSHAKLITGQTSRSHGKGRKRK